MAKELKEPTKDEDIRIPDSLTNDKKCLKICNNEKKTDISWSKVRIDEVSIEDERVDENVLEEDSNLKELEELTVRDTIVTIDTTDKRDKRMISNQRNTYAAKKTVAQGMMDVALITANANQLRYLIEYQRKSPTFYVNVFLIVCSLLLQVSH